VTQIVRTRLTNFVLKIAEFVAKIFNHKNNKKEENQKQEVEEEQPGRRRRRRTTTTTITTTITSCTDLVLQIVEFVAKISNLCSESSRLLLAVNGVHCASRRPSAELLYLQANQLNMTPTEFIIASKNANEF